MVSPAAQAQDLRRKLVKREEGVPILLDDRDVCMLLGITRRLFGALLRLFGTLLRLFGAALSLFLCEAFQLGALTLFFPMLFQFQVRGESAPVRSRQLKFALN